MKRLAGKRTYRKHISLKYEYIKSPEGEKALEEVFDDIFRRIVKKDKEEKEKNVAKY